MRYLIDDTLKELEAKEEKEGNFELKLEKAQDFDELYRKKDENDTILPRIEVNLGQSALIMHSSGRNFLK